MEQPQITVCIVLAVLAGIVHLLTYRFVIDYFLKLLK